jgi:hypothetical protein
MHPAPAELEQAFYQSLGDLLFSSYHKITSKYLIKNNINDTSRIVSLFNAPCAIVAHGMETDPIFNFGNRVALELFSLNWPEFIALPSRKSAEPLEREERKKLLDEVTHNGFINNYSGIRVASNGNRFLIEQAFVWNLIDDDGHYCGQAATFSKWKAL